MLDLSHLRALAHRFGSSSCEVTEMPGGASTRRYFRLVLDGGRSAVAMFVPGGARAEEIDNAEPGARWPFLEVRDLLHERGVEVPEVLAEDTERGWLLLEDLGDNTLANYLLEHPEQKLALYQRAVRALAQAQRALRELPSSSVVRRRAFDEALLRWEIDHFREWALEARGHSLTALDRQRFDEVAERLAKRIASMPRGFVHRDYQSRNLMVRLPEANLVWIDFQDALLGPRSYDLVALLGDSYQSFDAAFVRDRQDEFAAALGLDEAQATAMRREFDWVMLQRKLKDAGRFVYIDRVKGNPHFLQFVTPTLHKVQAALARLHDDADARCLAELLTRLLPGELGLNPTAT